jgi:hypothetical protein
MSRRLAIAVMAALVLFAVTTAGCRKDTGGGTSTTPTVTPSASSTKTLDPATLAQLEKSKLSDMKESLVFSYVQLGGVPALETRFGQPSVTYQTYAKDPSGGSLELKDGRAYRFEWGYDAQGKAVVTCHVVEAINAKQKATAGDKAFVAALVDGKTTLEEANAYLTRVGGSKAVLATVDTTAAKVPALVWNQPDGSGFVVIDLTGLTADQMKAIGMEDSGPYQALWWNAAHWRAFEG